MRAHPLGRAMLAEPLGIGGFRSRRLKETAAGRDLDPSSADHGESALSEGDTGFQEAKTATSGPCSRRRAASSRSPSAESLGREFRAREPRGARACRLRRVRLAGEAAPAWAQGRGSRRAQFPLHSVNRAVRPEPGSVLFCWLCARVLERPRGWALEQTRICANCPSIPTSLSQHRRPNSSKINKTGTSK